MYRTLRSNSVRLALSLAVAVTVVGCGGDDDDAATTDAPTETVEVADTDAADTTEAVEATDPEETTADTEAAPTTDAVETTDRATTTAPETTEVDTTVAAAGFPYTSVDGDYTVTFPGAPDQEFTQPQVIPGGESVDIVFVGYSVDEGLLATARAVYPDGTVLDVPTALQGAQDQAIANTGATLISSQDITLQGRPGREFSASVTNGGVEGTLLQRVYLDGLVIYQQIFTGAGEATFTSPELAEFFESFAFTTG